MYENATTLLCTKTRCHIWSPLSQLFIVQPNQIWPFQALPYEHHLLRPPSHNCLWRVQTDGCYLSTIRQTWVKSCQLSTIWPTWVKGCQLLTIQVQWRPKWMVISYQQYKYNDNLSEKLSVINNTTDLSERLLVINNTTNLSKGLPVINNTSVKITFVIVFSINAWWPVVANLCGLWTIGLLVYIAYNLWDCWPFWSITYDLCGLWSV